MLTSLAVHWTLLPYASFKHLSASAGVALATKAKKATNNVSSMLLKRLFLFLLSIVALNWTTRILYPRYTLSTPPTSSFCNLSTVPNVAQDRQYRGDIRNHKLLKQSMICSVR